MNGVEQVVEGEAWIRLGSFFSILILMLLWEQLLPRRAPLSRQTWRRSNNLLLVVLNALLLKLLIPLSAASLAIYSASQGWGVFNLLVLPVWLEIVLAVILLDLLIYWQHRLFHVLQPLWRLHQVHHADMDYDTTTGLRFHPIEIILSMLIKFSAVVLLDCGCLSRGGKIDRPRRHGARAGV